MTATCHDPGAQLSKTAVRPPATSQFYRLFHLGSGAEPPKVADIEIQGGIVIAAHPSLAFMIGWAIEKVLEKLVKHNFKFSTLPGACRTSLFVTKPPSLAQRRKAKRAGNVKPVKLVKPAAPAKPAVKRAKVEVLMPAAAPAGQSIPNSMASLPRTVVSMGRRVR
jgi:hypothetical protein